MTERKPNGAGDVAGGRRRGVEEVQIYFRIVTDAVGQVIRTEPIASRRPGAELRFVLEIEGVRIRLVGRRNVEDGLLAMRREADGENERNRRKRPARHVFIFPHSF